MKYTLRPYQSETVDKLIADITNPSPVIACLAQGAGKSLIIAELANRLNTDVLILSPSREITTQNSDKMRTYVDDSEIGIYSASLNSKVIKKYTFATIGSCKNHKELFSHFKIIIIDECDLVNPKRTGSMFMSFLKQVKPIKVIGFTATPFRLCQEYQKLKNGFILTHTMTKMVNRIFCGGKLFWKDIICNVTTQELIDAGYLVPNEYHFLSLTKWEDIPINKSKSDFDLARYSKAINNKLGVVTEVIAACEQKFNSVLVFCASVEQAVELQGLVAGSEVVSALTKPKDRKRIVDNFKNGTIKTVFNYGVLTCIIEDMELLTKTNGWVGIDDIKKNDLVAQYDIDTQKINFVKPLHIIKKKITDEEMVEVNGKFNSFLVTKDHNLLYKKYKFLGRPKNKVFSKFEKIKAIDSVGKKFFIPVSGYSIPEKIKIITPTIKKGRFLSTNSYNYRKKGLSYYDSQKLALEQYDKKSSLRYKNPSELTLEECNFIGFWLGDGSKSMSKSGGMRYSIVQSWSTPGIIKWIENCLKKCEINYSFCDHGIPGEKKDVLIAGIKCQVNSHRSYTLSIGTGGNKQNVNGLYKVIPYLEKDGSSLFWGFNRNQFFSLMEGLFKADGYHGNYIKYIGQPIIGEHKKLFDLLQAIGVCRGYKMNIHLKKKRKNNKHQLYTLSLKNCTENQLVIDIPKIIKSDKSKRVWCVNMPKGTIITRRNGLVTIMGNCGFDHPDLDCIVNLRPTQSIRLYCQMLGRGSRICEGKTKCFIFDFTGTVKRLGRVETFAVEKAPFGWDILSEKGYWHKKILYSFQMEKK